MRNKSRWLFVLGMLILWAIFTFIGGKTLDPDFGWHLRVGEILINQGIPKTDPFSYTMPSFPWVDHGRMSDVMIAWLYPRIGMGGLASIFALIAILALVVVIPVGNWGWGLVPILIGAGVFFVRFGVRPQIEDWLWLAILLRVMEDGMWKKWRWIVPIIFAVWANFHGGFAVGLAVLGVRVAGRWWEAKKWNNKDGLVLGLAVAATMINPYGWRLWRELWLTISDIGLRQSIAEWQPFFVRAELGFWMVAAMAAASIKIYGWGREKWKLAVLVLLFTSALSSLRNAPLFTLVAIAVVAGQINNGYERIKKDKLALKRAKQFYLVLVLVAGVVFAQDAGLIIWHTMAGKGISYPIKAVEFLEQNNFEGRLFSNYGWGGYLIWKMPEKKVFIDGRMPSWRWPHFTLWGYDWGKQAPASESDWAFKDYVKIEEKGEFGELFKKYRVGVVLWPKGGEEGTSKPLIDLSEISWLKNLIGGEKGVKLTDELEKEGWKKVYEDETAVIYTDEIIQSSTN